MTTRAELSEWARNGDRYQRQRAAWARSTPPADLDLLTGDAEPFIRDCAMRNPRLPAATVERLVAAVLDGNPHQAVLENPSLTQEQIESVATSGLYDPLRFLSHRNCPEALLRAGFRSDKPWVRASAAKHRRLPEDLWDAAISDSHHSVRGAALHNKSIPADRLGPLVNDKNLRIVRGVVVRATGQIREQAEANLRRRSKARHTKWVLASHSEDGALLDELAMDAVPYVRHRAARNPNASEEARVAAALLG